MATVLFTYFLPVISVIIGGGTVLCFSKYIQRYISILLSFSGAFLLSITLCHLIPELFSCENHYHGNHQMHSHETHKLTGIWIIIGVLLQKILEYFSEGAEHGELNTEETQNTPKDKKTPWLIICSLCIHALLEGMPTYQHHKQVWISIFIHKIPVAILFTSFLLGFNFNRWKTIGLLILFGIMTPLGRLLYNIIDILDNFHVEISALVIGIFLHVATIILFESNKSNKFNLAKLGVTLLAIIMAFYID